jgi:TolB protein
LALGAIDAMDVLSNNDEIANTEVYYRLLNCGFRLAMSAGTDSFTNVADHYTMGGGRVYVYVGDRLRYDEWVRNYKGGRSFVSNGPMLSLRVNGKQPGEELKFTEGAEQKVRVQATLATQIPVDVFEIVVNGKVVSSRPLAGSKNATIDEQITLGRSSWLAARALGPGHRLVLNDVQAYAHTSPVHIVLGGRKLVVRDDAHFFVDWIERLIARVEERGRFTTPEHKKEVIDLFHRGLDVYRKLEKEATS